MSDTSNLAGKTDSEVLAFILRMFSIFDGFIALGQEDLFWRIDGVYAPVTCFINCSDLFVWGCADLEPVTPENIDDLVRAIDDVRAADIVDQGPGADPHAFEGPALFVARVRKMRPQRPCFKDWEKRPAICALFNACGPERAC